MTENRTSQAVSDLLNRRRAGEENPFEGLSYDDVLKIAEKYQKMQEALEDIKKDAPNCNCYRMQVDPDCVCGPCKAKRALAFDPLAS